MLVGRPRVASRFQRGLLLVPDGHALCEREEWPETGTKPAVLDRPSEMIDKMVRG